MKIAFFFSIFPTLSTTFLQREVRAIKEIGLSPVLVANRPPLPGYFHPVDKDLLEQTYYLTGRKIVQYLRPNIELFFKNPKRYLSSVKLALSLTSEFPLQRLKNLTRLAGAAVLAKYLMGKNVIHVHVHFAFGAAGVAILLEALSGISYGLSIHGSDVLLSQPLIEEKLKRARYIVSNCRFHIDNLKKKFPSLEDKRFYIVRLGLEMHKGLWTGSKKHEFRAPFRILNVARLDPVKAHEILILACSHLKSKGIAFHCKIAGHGSREKELECLIEELGLSGEIELLGPCYERKIAQLFEWSHVMVLSSRSEGTPMTVIEAMAKCRPVVAPKITALSEIVEHGQTGLLFKSGNPDDLADCLTSLVDQPDKMISMGAAGRKKAEAMFNPLENARKFQAVLGREIPDLLIKRKTEGTNE